MRKVGEFTERAQAERFHAFLASEKVAADLRDAGADGTAIWVHDEDLLQVAEAYLTAFRAHPEDPRFNARPVAPKADTKRAPRARFPAADAPLYTFGGYIFGNLTLALVIISVASTVLVDKLQIRSFFYYFMPLILEGQVWRLVTPIFLHGGWMHLLFNMMWLLQLGGMVEVLEGKGKLLGLTLVLAILANSSQYFISGPNFLGMSGVVYGYLGYIWMMSRYAAGTQYVMPQQTVYFMIVWMVVCLIGIIPNVANAEHVTGFVVGTAWGYLGSGHMGAARRRQRFKDKL